jgi:hypothetical protein
VNTFIYTCERCGEHSAGSPYRVISENDGETLFDLVVCYGCYMEAAQLGLHTEAIEFSQAARH